MKKISQILIAAYLTVGQNHNLMLGNGTSYGLNIDQPITSTLSLCPFGFFDRNDGFKDRSGGLDISWKADSRLTFILGSGYEKYELLGAPPTETSNVHTSVVIKLW